jgi:hypothetical protein
MTHRTRATFPQATDRYRLGDAGLSVSPVCLGITADPRTVCEAFDAGINFFFVSADMHWPLYEGLRRGLEMLLARGGGVRDQIVVGSVSYVTQPEFSVAPFREVIAAVKGLGRLDLTIAGGAYSADLAIRLQAYGAHQAGVVPGARAVGVSFHDRAAAGFALERRLVDIGYVRYNAAHPGAEHDVFPRLTDSAPLVYSFKSTGGFVPKERCPDLGVHDDGWVPELTDHYRYVLSCAEVSGLLCALTQPAHVRGLVDALGAGPLNEQERAYVRELARRAFALPVDPTEARRERRVEPLRHQRRTPRDSLRA